MFQVCVLVGYTDGRPSWSQVRGERYSRKVDAIKAVERLKGERRGARFQIRKIVRR